MRNERSEHQVDMRRLPKVTLDVKNFVLRAEDERRSLLWKTWSSILPALMGLVLSLVSLLAQSRSIYQVVLDRWGILVAILVSSVTVALTVTFALRQSRRARRLTEDVIAAYQRALNASIVNPSVGAKTRG